MPTNRPAPISLAALAALLGCVHVALAQVAVRGRTVYTMAPEGNAGQGQGQGQGQAQRPATFRVIRDGVVVITDGKIVAVGPAASTPIPPGHRVLEAEVVTPGLIDARATVGLTGLYNSPHDSDQLERSTAMQPELRAIDAYNPQDRLVEWVRSFGVTTVHTGHAPGELISGQTAIIKTTGNTVDEAVLVETAAVSATVGPGAFRSGGNPGTRAKSIAMLRQELLNASAAREKHRRAAEKNSAQRDEAGQEEASGDGASSVADGDRKDPPAPPDRNLRQEMIIAVLDGKVPLLVRADRAQDIAGALRLAEEFGIRLMLDSAAESYMMIEEIRRADVPVLVHPLMQRAVGEMENQSFTTPAALARAGIPFAIQSGYEGYVPKVRVVLLEAAIAAANGLSFEQTLEAITISPARLLGVADRVGSLEVGKDGDVALYAGDPFEYTTRCVGVVINGAVVSDTPR